MKSQKSNASVEFTSSISGRTIQLSFSTSIDKSQGDEEILKKVRRTVKQKYTEKYKKSLNGDRLPSNYQLTIETPRIYLDIEKNVTQWRYWFRNRETGQRSPAQFVETSNKSYPQREALEETSRLSDFSDTWELMIEATNRTKVNGKWMTSDQVENLKAKLGNLRIKDVAKEETITRTVVKDNVYKKQEVRNPDYESEAEIRFSYAFLHAS